MQRRLFSLVAGAALALQTIGPPSSAWAQARRFAGQNLSGRDYSHQTLEGADFAGARLRGASFRRANLRGANLSGADLSGTDLDGADLSGANLAGARGTIRADNVNFAGADLTGVELGGSLSRTTLTGARLEGADLRTMTGGALSSKANLGGSVYSEATRWPPSVDPERVGAVRAAAAAPAVGPASGRSAGSPEDHGTRLPEAAQVPSPRETPDARAASGAEAGRSPAPTGKTLRGQDLSRRDLRQQNLDGADLDGADLTFATLTGVSLRKASLRHARLANASFRSADLTGADLRGAELATAVFVDAKLRDAKLEDQTLFLAGASVFFDKIKDLPFGIRDYATGLAKPDLHNGSLTLQRADLRRARIVGNLQGVDFRGADLRGADLSETENLHEAILQSAIYDGATRWKIDPDEVRAKRGQDLPPRAAGADGRAPGGKPFIGQWVIEAVGASQRIFIRIDGGGVYAWDAGADRPMTTGSWEASAPGGGSAALILKAAEDGRDLRLTLVDASTLKVDGGGASVRTAYRLPAE